MDIQKHYIHALRQNFRWDLGAGLSVLHPLGIEATDTTKTCCGYRVNCHILIVLYACRIIFVSLYSKALGVSMSIIYAIGTLEHRAHAGHVHISQPW